MTEERRACARCGKVVPVVKSRHLLAHSCPHGKVCVPTYAARREGERAGQCETCNRGRQLPLFG